MTTSHSMRVNIDLDRVIGLRDTLFFGHFLEHFHRQIYGGIYDPASPLADSQGFRADVVAALKKIKPSVIRWPGGCFVSAYHWRDAVGPLRVPSFDKAWRVEEPNTFGTDEFVAFCKVVGTEPYLCTNAGTGTPEEMSDWVEYCNLDHDGRWARLRRANGHLAPHNVRYWSIGNENYGWWEIGAKDAGEWGCFVAEAAKMMKRVDHTITLSAAATADLQWNLNLLQTAGRYLDLVALHDYPARGETNYITCMSRLRQAEERITAMEHTLGVLGLTDRIRIAFDEWNPRGWHHPGHADIQGPSTPEWPRNDENATYTMADAIMYAGFLNSCLRHCRGVAMTNLSPVVNTRGAIYTHPEGLVLRSTYHVCDLYVNHTYSEILDAFVDAPTFTARVEDGTEASILAGDVCVTLDRPSNRLAVALSNLHPDDDLTCRLWVPGSILRGDGTLRTITGVSANSYNDRDHPDDIQIRTTTVPCASDMCTLRLPAHSVNVLTLEFGSA